MLIRSRKCLGLPMSRAFASSRGIAGTGSPEPERADVVVVGGGMVGSTLACLLGKSAVTNKLRVVVLESQPDRSHEPLPKQPSLRVSSITPASAAVFQTAGAWARMRQKRVSSFTEMQVWDTFARGRIHWKASDHGLAELGYIVENDVIQHSLTETMRELAAVSDVQLRNNTDVKRLQYVSDEGGSKGSESGLPNAAPLVAVHLSDGRVIHTRLVVGADGINSCVRTFGQVDATGSDYNQRGVVATVRTLVPHNTAWQRFLPSGPIAVLPCHGDYSSIVWSTSVAHAQHLCSVDAQTFISDVNNAFRAPPQDFQPGGRPSLFGQPLPQSLSELLPTLFPDPKQVVPPLIVELSDEVKSFPLRYVHCRRYTGHRFALMGDAAHVVHPLAGQGVNLGISDAEQLYHTITDAVLGGDDVGATALLQQYERKQQLNNALVLHGVDALQKVFSVRDGPFALLRSMGLDLFNSVPALKRLAADVAIGSKRLRL